MATSVGSWEQACGGMEPSLMNDGPANGTPLIGIHTYFALMLPIQKHRERKSDCTTAKAVHFNAYFVALPGSAILKHVTGFVLVSAL